MLQRDCHSHLISQYLCYSSPHTSLLFCRLPLLCAPTLTSSPVISLTSSCSFLYPLSGLVSNRRGLVDTLRGFTATLPSQLPYLPFGISSPIFNSPVNALLFIDFLLFVFSSLSLFSSFPFLTSSLSSNIHHSLQKLLSSPKGRIAGKNQSVKSPCQSPILQFLILLMICTGFSSGNRVPPKKTRLWLRDILPENRTSYDKMVPPKQDGEPTKVYFHVTVMGIDSINENSVSKGKNLDVYSENTVSSITLQEGGYSGTFATDIFFAQSWRDHRLRLPANMTDEYKLLDLDWLEHLWRPDSFFKNAKEVNFQTMTVPNHYMWLYQDFTLLYMVKLTLTLSCHMNFAIYPHDTQECNMQMESLSHTTDDLIFEWDPQVPLVVDEGIELPQQMILSNTTSECTQVYSTGNFTCLEVVFKLKRRIGHFLFHTYIPTCLIVIMSWVSFWIRPEIAPARVTLGVTSLLTLSTQQAKSQSALPPVTYIKAIDVFMSSCTIFVFMALMEYAVVSVLLGDEKLHKKKKRRLKIPPPPPPPSIKNLKYNSAFLKEMGGLIPESMLRGPEEHCEKTKKARERRARAIMLDRGSRYVFPTSFAVLNCIYWVTFWEYL